MSAVSRVPVTSDMVGDELSADDAWRTVRRSGWSICTDAFTRFRYGDGFSHSRALGLQLCLGVVPLVIATIGLSGTLHTAGLGRVLQSTVLSLTPEESRGVLRRALTPDDGAGADVSLLALWLGLAVAVLALTTAMAQVERGANRIYGIERDRPTFEKYSRAMVLALVVGIPGLVGAAVLVTSSSFGAAIERLYGVDDDAVLWVALPAGVVLMLASITLMLRHCPRRRQPGWSWLVLGAAVGLVLWLVFTGLLAGYLQVSGSLGGVYGPLTGFMALLLWAELTSVAIFFGTALSAQVELARVDVRQGRGT